MASPALALDHLVVGAKDLEQGVDWIARQLGVKIPRGGRHDAMGTHNGLMQIGGGAYLEVIAIDPDGVAPRRPRWFDLDNPRVAEVLEHGPRLLTWVARVKPPASLSGLVDPHIWGEPIAMSRDRLNWHITVPDDGRLPGAGLLPTVIEWQCDPPASSMADLGCRLTKLVLRYRAERWLRERLDAIGALPLVQVEATGDGRAGIEAVFDSPAGRVVIR